MDLLVLKKQAQVRNMSKHKHFLHGPLAGPDPLGPAAQEHRQREDEHDERHCRGRGRQPEVPKCSLKPGSVLCGTDMKANTSYTESQISTAKCL